MFSVFFSVALDFAFEGKGHIFKENKIHLSTPQSSQGATNGTTFFIHLHGWWKLGGTMKTKKHADRAVQTSQ